MESPENDHRCLSCASGPLRRILDLGLQPLANSLLSDRAAAAAERRYPLRLALCPECGLLQIEDLVPPAELFSDYVYFSSFSETMLRHARAAAERHIRSFGLGRDSFVVEIASNDGYLLRWFVEAGIPCLGVEPAANVAAHAVRAGVPTRVDFFGRALGEELAATGPRADLILGNNVFAHVPDTNGFVAGLAALLAPGGRIVLEFPDGREMLRHREFDTIYHEHVFYFTVRPLAALFARHGLEIVDLESLPIHGGSLRLTAAHRGAHRASPVVAARLAEEADEAANEALVREFVAGVEKVRDDLVREVRRLRAAGRTVAAYGASAKGSTLLNYCGFTGDDFAFLVDRSTHKQGKFSPGLHLPILPPEALLERRPDVTVLLTWNFADEILAQQSAYRAAGGRFLIPVPELRLA